MSKAYTTLLSDRGVIAVTGSDAPKFLNGLVTNDVAILDIGQAAHAGLLSPQGKILFDFFIVRTPEGFLLETAQDKAAELTKRLAMYKLRAAVTLTDVSADHRVLAVWGQGAPAAVETRSAISFADPRHPQLGRRILAEPRSADDIAAATPGEAVDAQAYHAHRIGLGVPEAGKDFAFADAYPHEADYDIFHGVSFKKGCYVGQEVVSRMQHKTVVRKRVVRVTGAEALTSGAEVFSADVGVGRIGSVAGREALALLRLDRAAGAGAGGPALVANGVALTVNSADVARYVTATANRDHS